MNAAQPEIVVANENLGNGKQLQVNKITSSISDSPISEISLQLNAMDSHQVDNIPWQEHPYKPDVNFSIAYGADDIFLKFRVKEQAIRAVNTIPNSEVWEDSCVEMFISFGNGYYNFEMNPIGAVLAAHGPDRNNRQFLPLAVTDPIRSQSIISRPTLSGPVEWSICVVIPVAVFIHDKISQLDGTAATANFFKCGDKTPSPHFLSWNPINAPSPDFHLPQFFGKLTF